MTQDTKPRHVELEEIRQLTHKHINTLFTNDQQKTNAQKEIDIIIDNSQQNALLDQIRRLVP